MHKVAHSGTRHCKHARTAQRSQGYTRDRVHMAVMHARTQAHAHVRTHTHTRARAYTRARTHARTHMCARMHARTHTIADAYTKGLMHARTHARARVHTCAHVNTRTHARTPYKEGSRTQCTVIAGLQQSPPSQLLYAWLHSVLQMPLPLRSALHGRFSVSQSPPSLPIIAEMVPQMCCMWAICRTDHLLTDLSLPPSPPLPHARACTHAHTNTITYTTATRISHPPTAAAAAGATAPQPRAQPTPIVRWLIHRCGLVLY